MKPLQTLVGVISSRPASSLTLMLPSFDAVYPRAYSRRPTSTMSVRSCSSRCMIPVRWRRLRPDFFPHSFLHFSEQKYFVAMPVPVVSAWPGTT